jgi:peptide/nickel transport system substrate-binding protein
VIVGVQAIPACFDVEHHRVSCPPEALTVHFQAYDTLLRHPVRADTEGFRAADAGDLQPGLATDWEASPDGRSYTFQLRQGVLSAQGHELTAHDVKWSWERAFALNSWSARASRACGVTSPDDVRVVQPYTLQFRIEEPHPLFPAMLATPLPPIYDLETVRQHCPVGDPWGDAWLRGHVAGFGPYTLEEGADAEEAALEANTSFWEGAARDRRVLLRTIAASSARADALWRGSVDVADGLSAADLPALAGKPEVRLWQFPGWRQVVLRIDAAFAPFDQTPVRQALALALPYEEIGRQVFNAAQGKPVRAEQDQRAARALLREAGYASGFRMTINVPQGDPDLEATAQIIQRDLMRLDLKVVVERLDRPLFTREKASRHLPIYLEERHAMSPLLAIDDLEPLPQVEALLVAQPADCFAARANLEGFVRRADGQPRYAELWKA